MPDPPDAALRALSDPNRRMIFERLYRDGEQTVARLTNGMGISQSAVSRHLKLLLDYGLVEVRPEGRRRFYLACPDALMPLRHWLNGLRGVTKPFDAMEITHARYVRLGLARDAKRDA